MKQKANIPILLIVLLAVFSCRKQTEPIYSEDAPPPDSTCKEIHHKLICYGFDYTSVKTIVFRTYKKGTDFKEFIKEYKSIMVKDLLAEQKPTSIDYIRKERPINIPEEINSDVDFILITTDSIEYRISEIKSVWQGLYGEEFLGWVCNLNSYKVNGEVSISNIKQIQISKPGFVIPESQGRF